MGLRSLPSPMLIIPRIRSFSSRLLTLGFHLLAAQLWPSTGTRCSTPVPAITRFIPRLRPAASFTTSLQPAINRSLARGILAVTAQDDSGNFCLYSHEGTTIIKVLATGDFGPFADTHARDYTATIGGERWADCFPGRCPLRFCRPLFGHAGRTKR